MKPYKARLPITPILVDRVRGCRDFIDQVRKKDVELVALHDLGGGVVVVVVRLVVLVPLVARVNAVEVLGLARAVLVVPPIHLRIGKN